jgi:hypothetical protein
VRRDSSLAKSGTKLQTFLMKVATKNSIFILFELEYILHQGIYNREGKLQQPLFSLVSLFHFEVFTKPSSLVLVSRLPKSH